MRRTINNFEIMLSAVALLVLTGAPVQAQTAAARAKARTDSIRADSIRTDSIKKAAAKKPAATAATSTKAATTKTAPTNAATTKTVPASTPASAKAATSAAKPTTASTAVPAKATSATTTKPASGTTTTKPAAGAAATKAPATDTKAATAAKPASGSTTAPTTSTPAKATGASSGTNTSRPATTSTRAPAASTKATSTGTPRPQEPAAYTSLSLYGGLAKGSLGFGNGASAGLALRMKRASLPVVFRVDVGGSRFSQTPTAFGGTTLLSEKAALTHAGATASLELPLVNHGAVRPYLMAGGGVYRFQGSGPAGSNGNISDGVFTSTTDGALNVGGGILLGRHFFVEARYITVGDFNSIPVVLGLVFR